ncbi:MAG: nuclear transport factor 2 family protein [Xanthomonadaceae bacterium]|nr:nuclear transport factor 2 family protein [Xanthomonadaceae bacterium]MDE1885983.1 nuclear transport factor 2 family protein [Xanthomonadaceae bacterium]MDE1960795.1 nuclear transport factor 2 family protein [Xanthomonadaceae bacterium]MDE2084034.1 nuclear transport factor 2 family protein [Xanthomonadaceae bacterium]MDE2256974.1 nuclear transport factor 2 family protein [Xanthomonadaceae bacterium]
MKSLHALAALALLAVVCSSARAGLPSVRQSIEPVMAKMFAAANAHDTDAFMAPYLRSQNFVFAINGEVIRGWDALHAQQLKWWNDGKSDARYTQNGSPQFLALGTDVELVTWPLAAHRTGPDGKAIEYNFVVTYVWQRLPQGWRIVQGHESFAKPSN